jgi:hypothetical protein
MQREYTGTLVNDCSGYFKRIAMKLSVPVPPLPADGLIDHIAANWIKIGKGIGDGPKAQRTAEQGFLVVALLKAKDHHPFKYNPKTKKYDIPHPYHHGHLAIVLSRRTNDYPFVICGSTIPEGKSNGNKKVYERGAHSPWREIDASKVEYYRTIQPVADPPN